MSGPRADITSRQLSELQAERDARLADFFTNKAFIDQLIESKPDCPRWLSSFVDVLMAIDEQVLQEEEGNDLAL